MGINYNKDNKKLNYLKLSKSIYNFSKNQSFYLNNRKLMSKIKIKNNLFELKKELEDRFGKLPEETENLIKIARIRILSSKLSIYKILSEQDRIFLFLNSKSPLKPKDSNLEKIFLNYSTKEVDKIDFVLNKLVSFNEQNKS